MPDERRQKLVATGVETLADALLELAEKSGSAERLVERLTAPAAAAVENFKKQLAVLKRSKRFIDWRSSAAFARELAELLLDLRAGVSDPRTGIGLVADFYGLEKVVLGRCDDSDGTIGDVFRHDARELFVHYASDCADKEAVAATLLKLVRKDDCSLRFPLLDSAVTYLPEPLLGTMVTTIRGWLNQAKSEYDRVHHSLQIESLARQLKDVRLYTETRLALYPQVTTASCIDIARVCLECGELPEAAEWLDKIPAGETFLACERDRLLEELYRQQGDGEKLTSLLTRNYGERPSLDTLQELLAVIGEEQRENMINMARERIRDDVRFHGTHASFLLDVGRTAAAAEYVMAHAGELDGNLYNSLLPLADEMAKAGQPLAASLLYRALLLSILERGYTKAYPHGIRYLKKLEKLAAAITDWQGVSGHAAFLEILHRDHGRKTSFWSKCGA